ncbi:hypothetical protein PUN28_009537 [Cardiocondyla obscurior]|uniref:Uncharacterized protein n=1 Tax=Cardiocondyla obscurior TaxID=286306 RepID=A0AAW2FUU3_9HYME
MEKLLPKKVEADRLAVYGFRSLFHGDRAFKSTSAADNSSRNSCSFELYSRRGRKFSNRKPCRVHVHKKFSHATRGPVRLFIHSPCSPSTIHFSDHQRGPTIRLGNVTGTPEEFSLARDTNVHRSLMLVKYLLHALLNVLPFSLSLSLSLFHLQFPSKFLPYQNTNFTFWLFIFF